MKVPTLTTNKSPLADRMRPQNFEEFFGQEEISKESALIRKAIAQDNLPSLILWGPPGFGNQRSWLLCGRRRYGHALQAGYSGRGRGCRGGLFRTAVP
jgi:putative ATPase